MGVLTADMKFDASAEVRGCPTSRRAVFTSTPGRLVELWGDEAADPSFAVWVQTPGGCVELVRASRADEPERLEAHALGNKALPWIAGLVAGDVAAFPAAARAGQGDGASLESLTVAHAVYLFERERAVKPPMGREARQLQIVAGETRAMVVAAEAARAGTRQRERWAAWEWSRTAPVSRADWWRIGRWLYGIKAGDLNLHAAIERSATGRASRRDSTSHSRWAHPATYDAHLRVLWALIGRAVPELVLPTAGGSDVQG